MSDFEARVLKEGPTMRFSFSSPSGPVRALTVAVADISNKRFLWQLTSISGPDAAPDPHAEWAKAMAARAGVHREELRTLAERFYGGAGNAVVEDVIYGEVPEGFKQTVPASGPPPALQPGVKYAVCLWGTFEGARPFEVP